MVAPLKCQFEANDIPSFFYENCVGIDLRVSGPGAFILGCFPSFAWTNHGD